MGFLKKVFKGIGKALIAPSKLAAKGVKKTGEKLSGKTAVKRAGELLGQQEESQQRLNEADALRNFEYGEQAADAAHERSLGLLSATTQANSLESQVADAKAAGLSVGYLYGGGASGMGGSAAGAAQGGGARGLSSDAPNYLEVESIRQQNKLVRAEQAKVASEAALNRAQAKSLREEIETSKQLSPLQARILDQEGWGKFIENEQKTYELGGGNQRERKEPEHIGVYDEFRSLNINADSLFSEERSIQIAKAIEETKGIEINNMLKDQEAKIAWRNLLIAEANGETERAKNEATTLALKWGIGEYKNWKTWTNVAGTGIEAITSLIRAK